MAQRIAYVTGGMGGIGTSICQRLSKGGFKRRWVTSSLHQRAMYLIGRAPKPHLRR